MRTSDTILLILSLLLIGQESFSQATLLNTTLTKPEKKILHIGIDNRIEIANGNENAEYHLKSNDVTIRNTGINSFAILASTGDTAILQVFKDSQFIQRDTFQLKTIPWLVLKFGDGDSVASFEEIKEKPKLYVKLPNCYLKHFTNVHSFEVFAISETDTTKLSSRDPEVTYTDTILTKSPITLNDTTIIITQKGSQGQNTGSYLTDYQIKSIEKLQRGDTLLFNVKIRGLYLCSMSGKLKITIE